MQDSNVLEIFLYTNIKTMKSKVFLSHFYRDRNIHITEEAWLAMDNLDPHNHIQI